MSHIADYYGSQQVLQARNFQLQLGTSPIPGIQQQVIRLEEASTEATDNARRMYMDESLSIISDTSKDSGIPAGAYMCEFAASICRPQFCYSNM